MTTYHWYCPECGREDYDYPEDDEEPKVCSSCGADLCQMESESKDEDDSAASEEGAE